MCIYCNISMCYKLFSQPQYFKMSFSLFMLFSSWTEACTSITEVSQIKDGI